MCIYLSGEKQKKYSEFFLHDKYVELKERIAKEDIEELYWNGDPYDHTGYTRIIQKLIDNFKHTRFRFIATHASTCHLGYNTHHCMQLCVYVRDKTAKTGVDNYPVYRCPVFCIT